MEKFSCDRRVKWRTASSSAPPGERGWPHTAQLRGQVRERRRTRVARPLVARAAPGVRVLEDQLFTCWHAKTSRGTRRLPHLAQVCAVTIDIGGSLGLGRA